MEQAVEKRFVPSQDTPTVEGEDGNVQPQPVVADRIPYRYRYRRPVRYVR